MIEDGFYWVRPFMSDDVTLDRWQPAELRDGERWYLIGDDRFLARDDIAEIGERIVRQ